ncbi:MULTISPECIES: hypothetical protein [unclassified Streptomyces]|uniref:hypothetical protein n=1 Tax=unclassified Streptomyces TaxID=2593676 RepID=UPI002E27B0BD|nr:hypothetical protein [Streptomyces sp. NBC_00273]
MRIKGSRILTRALPVAAMALATLVTTGNPASAAGLGCSEYACDGWDPGPVSWDSGPSTDSTATIDGYATVALRSGKKDGRWYGWAKTATRYYKYGVWIDRSTDGGKTWDGTRGYEHRDGGEAYTSMQYWPDGTWLRACVNVEGVKLACTAWVS